MVELVVSSKLRAGEEIINSFLEGFDYPNKSIVGTQALHMSNRGRIFAYDSGGMFGTERVIEYDAKREKVGIFFAEGNVVISNISQWSSINFQIDLTYMHFVELYAKWPETAFTFLQNEICLIKYGNEFERATYSISSRAINIDGPTHCLLVPFSRIKSLEYNKTSSMISLMGLFEQLSRDTFIEKIDLFFPNSNDLEKISDCMKRNKNIFCTVSDSALISPAAIREKQKEYTGIFVYQQNSFYIFNEQTSTITHTFTLQDSVLFFDKEKNILLIIQGNQVLNLMFEKETPLKNILIEVSSSFCNRIGIISGTNKGRIYKEEEVSLLFDRAGKGYQFYFQESLECSDRFEFTNSTKFFSGDLLFIFMDDASFLLSELENPQIINGKMKCKIIDINEGIIGFFGNGIPFSLIHNQREISIKQSNSIKNEILNKEITDISVVDQYEESLFTRVQIIYNDLENKKQKKIIFIPRSKIKGLIYWSYYFKKENLLKSVPPEKLFVSWSRQINDYILYNFMGQFFAIQAGIEEIQNENIDKELKYRKLINLLYYGLQNQKQILDTTAVYIPAMLDNKQRQSFNISGTRAEYKNLQQQLLGLGMQMNRHLNEIQSSLTAISFAIIPRKEMDEFIKNKAIKGGVLAGAIGLVAPPMGIIMGLNTLFYYKDMNTQEEIKRENENYRINFYLEKAIDTFNHFMEIMLPFYISETNERMFQSFKRMKELYKPLLGSEDVCQEMLMQIAEIHTFKQLPIDYSVNTKKVELVNEINKSLLASQSLVNYYQEEITIKDNIKKIANSVD